MPNPIDLLGAYANTPAVPSVAPVPAPRTPVEVAAQTAAVGNGFAAGAATAPELEHDLRNLEPAQLFNKYGPSVAAQMIGARADAEGIQSNNLAQTRTPWQATGDMLTDVAIGAGGAVGGLVSAGVGLADADAGATVARAVDGATQWAQDTQSDRLQNRRTIQEQRNTLHARDNTALYEQERAQDGDLKAGLRRIGRDAIDAIAVAADDPTNLMSGVSQGIGSMLGIGALAKKVGGVVGAVSKSGTPSAAVTAGTIGAVEASGTFQQTMMDVLNTPIEVLEQSPEFIRIKQRNPLLTDEEARNILARQTATQAAAIMAPVAIAAGRLTPSAGNPTSVASLGSAVRNTVLHEPVEEAIQGGASELAGNYALQQNVDANTDLTAGVGQQVGTGALYGMGTSAVLQGPAAAATSSVQTVSGAFNAVKQAAQKSGEFISARAEAKREEAGKASPVADAVVQEAAAAVQQTAPVALETVKQELEAQTVAPEVKDKAIDFVSRMTGAIQLTPEFTEGIQDPALKAQVAASQNKVEALQNLATQIDSPTATPQQSMEASFLLYRTLQELNEFVEADVNGLVDVPFNSSTRQQLEDIQSVLGMIGQSPKMAASLAKVHELINKVAVDTTVPIPDEAIATPDGQLVAQAQIAVAMHAPEKANPAAVKAILAHAENGKIQLKPHEVRALQLAEAIALAAQEYDAEVEASGHNVTDGIKLTGKDVVTRDDREERGSVVSHSQGILKAMQAGDMQGARTRMQEFGNFVRHMQNKVDALNRHLHDPKTHKGGATYASYSNKKWIQSPAGIGVTPYKAKSVRFAQVVSMEAKLLANVYSTLAKTFPDLGATPVNRTTLDPLLEGTPETVADEFDKFVRRAGSNAAPTPVTPVVEETAPVVEPVAQEAAPVVEPKKEQVPVAEKTTPVQPKPEPIQEKPAVVEQKAAAPVQPVAETVVVPEQVSAAEESGRAVAKLYPNLLPQNRFWEAYLPAEFGFAKLIDEDSPMAAAWDLLQNSPAAAELRAFLEQSGKSLLKGVKTQMQDYLQASLSKKAHVPLEQKVREGIAQGYEFGRATNLLMEQDGKLVYDQKLLELATLAALQWSLVSDQNNAKLEATDVAAMTGGQAEQYSEGLLLSLGTGIGRHEAVAALAQKIRDYWGVRNDPAANIGLTDGIAYGMAAEFISLMIREGDFTEKHYYFDEQGNFDVTKSYGRAGDKFFDHTGKELSAAPKTGKDGKTIVRMYPKQTLSADSALRADLYAIDGVAIAERDTPVLVGKVPSKAATRQLRNNRVVNTDEQVTAIENEQATPYNLNKDMVKFYEQLGLDGLLDLLDVTKPDPEQYNVNHFATLEGQYLTAKQGYESLFNVVKEVDHYAKDNDVAPEEVPLHYRFNFNRLGRLQMLGKNNPQASKIVREAILPTRATLNLNNVVPRRNYMLAIAQGLGIKVNNLTVKDSVAKAEQALHGPLKPAVDILTRWHAAGQPALTEKTRRIIKFAFVNAKHEGYPVELSAVALHTLVDYSRFLGSKKKDRAAFTTAVYLEADGVANGPTNAMYHLSSGEFTKEQMDNLAKGGLFLGKKKLSLGAHKTATNSIDLYQTAANSTKANLANLYRNLGAYPEVQAQHAKLIRLMELLLPDMEFVKDANGNMTLTLQRGVAKNPLTITVYGSGEAGLANKITSLLVDEIYARMSIAVQTHAADNSVSMAQAMFGNTPYADKQFDRFTDAVDSLIANEVAYSQKHGYFLAATDMTAPSSHPAAYTLEPAHLRALSNNVRQLFVKPMRAAITETIGSDTMDNATLLRQVTQVQSILLVRAFRAELDALLAQKAKDPKWKKSDFISRDELNGLYARVKHLSPLLDLGNQEFFISGAETTQMNDSFIARSLDEIIRMEAMVAAPVQAGVGGIPITVIGSGDAAMMLNLATNAALQGNLKVFDGVNLSLENLEADARRVNEAVGESWKLNPLMSLYEGVKDIAADANFAGLSKDDIQNIYKAAGIFDKDVLANADQAGALKITQSLVARLGLSAVEAQARREAFGAVSSSIDQMAAANAPFQTTGKDLSKKSEEEVLTVLNTARDKALEKVNKDKSKKADVTALEKMGKSHASGAHTITMTELRKSAGKLQIPAAQRTVFDEMLTNLAATDTRVVVGTPEQIRAAALADGQVLADGVNGQYIPENNTVYLINPSAEVLVHELVHAATFAVVHEYHTNVKFHNGSTLTEQDQLIAAAVKRIELLRTQFLSLGDQVNALSQEAQLDYLNAREAIMAAMDRADYGTEPVLKAMALNEFMAWGLSNAAVMRLQKRNEAHPLVRIGKKILEGIRELVWGKKDAGQSAGKDMLSNLLFNASILAKVQPNLSAMVRAGMLAHSTRYGTNARLQEIERTFHSKITDFLAQPVQRGVATPNSRMQQATMVAVDAAVLAQAKGFQMTAQESAVFKMVVAALATEIEVDSAALSKAQELFAHVAKHLKVEHFMVNPNSTNPADRYHAQEQFDVVTGNFGNGTDAMGRSTLLPIFLGLSVVSTDMRKALAKVELPKHMQADWSSLDTALEGVGNMAIDALSDRLTRTNKKDGTVQAAIDTLTDRIIEVAQDRESFVQQADDAATGFVGKLNQWVVDGMETLSDAAKAVADEKAGSDSVVDKLIASSATLLSATINEKNGKAIAEGIMGMANKTKMWQPLHDLLTDLVGRTQNNAEVYDMIKGLRSMTQQDRQQYREELNAVFAGKFSRPIEAAEWTAMFHGMGKTDLAGLLASRNISAVMNMLQDEQALAAEITRLEAEVRAATGNRYGRYQTKMQQLAKYMMTGEVASGLLRNAYAIVAMQASPQGSKGTVDDTLLQKVDDLTALYALQLLEAQDKATLSSLVQTEGEGVTFLLHYLTGQRVEEQRKVALSEATKMNHYKGFMPVEAEEGVSLRVAPDSEFTALREQGYVRVGPYAGSSAERKRGTWSYYYAPISGRAAFKQGVLQTVRATASGVDSSTGYTMGMTGGRITDAALVQRIRTNMTNEQGTEKLLPVYDSTGQIIAFERSVDPVQAARVRTNTHLGQVIGVWRGRQVEEAKADIINQALVKSLHDMYRNDMREGTGNAAQYVNLFDPNTLRHDLVLADAVALIPDALRAHINQTFDGAFMVRKDMLNDALGYRDASTGDLWSGNSRMNGQMRKVIRDSLVAVFGMDAYEMAVKGEAIVKNVVSEVRLLIAVKSVVVPVGNMVSNLLQLASRGVSPVFMAKVLPKKLAELETYQRSRVRLMNAEAELRAAVNDVVATRRLTAEIQAINDSHRRLSIWPLLEAGEFSSISDASVSREDVMLSSGRLSDYVHAQIEKLPPSLQTAAKYGILSKDTALFKGLQKSVAYGDFLAKAVLYDSLIQQKKMPVKEALGMITEEFVNYDRLPGRFRGYLESIGMLWFYNFKIRISKVAMATLRNNPVHALLAYGAAPMVTGPVGNPLSDGLFAKLLDGSLDASVGPGMAVRSLDMNPVTNLLF